MNISNPILPGFNPDPSICHVGDDFYIATSTFEWFPGVQIWHSRNLSEWTLVRRPLDEPRLLQLEGIQSSGGVWAPCLTHEDGLFYLVYTVVRTWRGEFGPDEGIFKDTHNYVTTAPEIAGPWSDPVYLNSSGFDPSLFHHDGRKYLVNMEWNYRPEGPKFSGILLQEYSATEKRLVGSVRKIFTGTSIGMTEGPHLYAKDGWFYLMTAEGGTSFGHAVTVARSRSLDGPYEVHPQNPLLNSLADRPADLEEIDLFRSAEGGQPPEGFHNRPQKAGHASMCRLSEDEWILVHLSGRPVAGSHSCPLGRETSAQRIIWQDEWPYVVNGDGKPTQIAGNAAHFVWAAASADAPEGTDAPVGVYRNTDHDITDEFEGPARHPAFRYLRRGPGDDMSLTARPGFLRVVGRESPISPFVQSLIGVSVTHFAYRVETIVEFRPNSFQQMAGLIVRYDERNQYYLRISGDDDGGRSIGVFQVANGRLCRPVVADTQLSDGPVRLELEVDNGVGSFSWSVGGQRGSTGTTLDMLQLSDEGATPLGFTGTFVCLACHDVTGTGAFADFARFEYSGR
jgi:xylan 1,4-beta-xylosidase